MPAFDVRQLDEVIHGRMRLGIMAHLIDHRSATFLELRALLDATKGNLSVHLGKLEAAGYVAIDKGYEGRKPVTHVRMTDAGRTAFAQYLGALGQLLGG